LKDCPGLLSVRASGRQAIDRIDDASRMGDIELKGHRRLDASRVKWIARTGVLMPMLLQAEPADPSPVRPQLPEAAGYMQCNRWCNGPVRREQPQQVLALRHLAFFSEVLATAATVISSPLHGALLLEGTISSAVNSSRSRRRGGVAVRRAQQQAVR